MRKSKQFATIALVVLALAGSVFAGVGQTTGWSWSLPAQKGVLTYSDLGVTAGVFTACTNEC